MSPVSVFIGGTGFVRPAAQWYYRPLVQACGCRWLVPLPNGGLKHGVEAVTERLAGELVNTYGPSEPLRLYGHSQGGLIAAGIARLLPQVRHVVALSAPFAGTQLALAGWALSQPLRDMAPGSGYLKRLQTWLPEVAARLTSIYLRHDLLIQPATSSHVAGATNFLYATAAEYEQARSRLPGVQHIRRTGISTNHFSEVFCADLQRFLANRFGLP